MDSGSSGAVPSVENKVHTHPWFISVIGKDTEEVECFMQLLEPCETRPAKPQSVQKLLINASISPEPEARFYRQADLNSGTDREVRSSNTVTVEDGRKAVFNCPTPKSRLFLTAG